MPGVLTGSAWRLGLAGVLLYMIAMTGLFSLQRQLIFPAPREVIRPALASGQQLLTLPGASAGPVYAFYQPPPPSGTVVVYFHGNGEQLADQVPVGQHLAAVGFGVLAVEYPGYGLARDQQVSQAHIFEANRTALAYLHGPLNVPLERTILLGHSLGSGSATELAFQGEGKALILMAPFLSIHAMSAAILPFAPPRFLIRDPFDNAAKAPHISKPVLIFHGTADSVVPFAQGLALSKRFPRATFEALEGVDHMFNRQDDVLTAAGLPVYQRLAAFVGNL